MRKRQIPAILLVGCMLLGQTVCAGEGAGESEKETAMSTQMEELNSEEMGAHTEDGSEEESADAKEENTAEADGLQGDIETSTLDKAQTSQNAESDEVEIPWDQLYLSEKAVYAQLPELLILYTQEDLSQEEFRVAVQDTSVCNAEVVSYCEGRLTVKFEGKQAGTTNVAVYRQSGAGLDYSGVYKITVREKPADAVDISDAAMNYALCQLSSGDGNRDGYISTSELGKITSLRSAVTDNPGLQIQDWSLLGRMDALNSIGLTGYHIDDLEFLGNLKNPENIQSFAFSDGTLRDYSALSKLTGLSSLGLDGNGLTDLGVLAYIQDPLALNRLELADNHITDLSALEGMGLSVIYLSGNEDLTDIGPLYGMEGLVTITLPDSVPDEARWELADFKDVSLTKGAQLMLPEIIGIFSDGLEVIPGENADTVLKEGVYYEKIFTAVAAGETTLTVKYHNLSQEIKVTVEGIPADQETGKDYGAKVETVEDTILESNGQLWQIYPEVKKKESNVKKYAAGWIYSSFPTPKEEYAYTLDNDLVLWSGSEKLAEDVMDFDSRYALKKNGTLVNIVNAGDEEIRGVKDWESDWNGNTRILKADGTLWIRTENPSGEEPEELTLLAEDVTQITYASGYLKADGTYWSYEGEKLADNVARIDDDANDYAGGSYYDRDGVYYADTVNGFIQTGKFQVKANGWSYNGVFEVYILTQDGDLYCYVDGREPELISEDVLQIGMYTNWIYQTSDGVYRDREGRKAENAVVETFMTGGDFYSLVSAEDGTHTACKQNVEVLTKVVHMWNTSGHAFCLRTDGTIWDITEIPQKVLDLQDPPEADYVRGDADGDGKADISDLRLVLRHVCRKTVLEDTAFEAADVTDDDKVDIQDLRKILRFVCRKITEL